MVAELSYMFRYPCHLNGCSSFFTLATDYDKHVETAHRGEKHLARSSRAIFKSFSKHCGRWHPDSENRPLLLVYEANTHVTPNTINAKVHEICTPDRETKRNSIEQPAMGMPVEDMAIATAAAAATATKENVDDAEDGVECVCTYKDCNRAFNSRTDMIQHKIQEPNHNYCKRCDVDCNDWNAFVIHKVVSQCRRSCPVCGADFKSKGGLSKHVKQLHPRDANLVCPGCDVNFNRVGAMIEHLEKGQCKNISKTEFHDHVTQKAMMKHIFSQADPSQAFTGQSLASSISNDKKEDPKSGGGSLTHSNGQDGRATLIDSDSTEHVSQPSLTPSVAAQSVHGSATAEKGDNGQEHSTLRTNPGDPTQVNGSTFAESAVPGMNKVGHNKASHESRSAVNKSSTPVNPNFSHTTASAWDVTNNTTRKPSAETNITTPTTDKSTFERGLRQLEAVHAAEVKSLKTGPVTSSYRHSNPPQSVTRSKNSEPYNPNAVPNPNDLHTKFWDPNSKSFNPLRFYNNALGCFTCPLNACNWTGPTSEDIRSHLIEAHRVKRASCPSCLRIFTTHTALIQHCESATTRCRIRNSNQFAHVIDRYSGGFVNVRPNKTYERDDFGELIGKRIDDSEWEQKIVNRRQYGNDVDDEDKDVAKEVLRTILQDEPRYQVEAPPGFW